MFWLNVQKSRALKFRDLVDCKTAQFLYKAKHNLLPGKIQKMFGEREGGYNLRGRGKLKQPFARTTLKSMCISVCGVKLWNSLPEDIKDSKNVAHLKTMFKNNIFEKYRSENVESNKGK